MGVSELEPVVDLFTMTALPADSVAISAEVIASNQRKVTEFLRGTYVRTSPAVEDLRARLDPANVDGLCAAAAAVIGSLSVRDAAGAARSGDWLTAETAAEIALEWALDAALSAAGDPYRSRKFLARRLSRIETLAPLLDDLNRHAGARETLLAANGIQAAALLATGPVWEREVTGDGPARSPYVTLLASEAGLMLSGGTDVKVPRPAAVLWLLADGRPLPDLAHRFAELHGLADDEVKGFVEKTVDALAEMGGLDVLGHDVGVARR